jgi:hypothetical protein
MIGELIAVLFLSRDLAHREHLLTTSYSKHKALQAFYEDVIDQAVGLAEAYMGRHGVIKEIPLMESDSDEDIDDILEEQMDLVEKLRYKAVEKTDTVLQNKIDEIVSLYLSTLYMLRRLK